MGKKYAIFITITAFISIASVVIICVSMGTEGWAYATVSPVSEITLDDSDANHGLFGGSLTRRLLQTPVTYDLHITCVWGSNACAWSCMSTAAARLEEVKSLLAGETPAFSCSASERSISPGTASRADNATSTDQFVNAGAWLSNVIFIVLLLVAATLSAVVSVVNTIWNPSESYFNVLGILITNSIAAGLDVIVLLVWGIHYAVRTQNDIAIRDTIVGQFVSESSLGYSYWLLLSPFFLHCMNIGLIALREWLMNSEPPETKIDIDDIGDGTLVLF